MSLKRKNGSSTTHQELVENTCKRLKNNYNNGYNEMDCEDGTNKIQPFKSFFYEGRYGIPARLAKLINVDVQNLDIPLPKYTSGYRNDVSLVDFCHVYQYLSAKEFDVSLLSNKTFDCVINAIISYLLDWPNEKLDEFVGIYPDYDQLCAAVKEFRELDEGCYIYNYNGIPVVKTAIKIIKSHFMPKSLGRNVFDWMSLLDYEFLEHIRQVYNWALNDDFDSKKTTLLEADMDIPYRLPNIDVTSLKQYDRDDNFKFITGEACCCKTTIINTLTEMGWKKYSRGDVGSFSGKSNNPAAIGNLHASLHYVLTQPDVIGDRGFIDNVLWTFIMPGCNPRNKKTFVHDLLSFLNSNFNEPSIAEYIQQKGVIFIDPKSDKNKERQLARCEDGDPWRGRLEMYTISQFMAYYVVARLFGWKVICVPYTDDGRIDDVRYKRNIETIVKYFGVPKPTGRPYVRYSKPSNFYIVDNSYSKSVGIFK